MNTLKTESLGRPGAPWYIAAGSLLGIIAGCADPFSAADDAQWYSARVVAVSVLSEFDDSINRRCLEGVEPMPEQVAVVLVRTHRAPHMAAFALPSESKVQIKDLVAVNFRLCQLRTIAN